MSRPGTATHRQALLGVNSLATFSQKPPRGLDSSVSKSARVWNYWLGGKDNYPVDHEAGDQFAAILPSIVDVARALLTSTPEGVTDYVDADLRDTGTVLREAAQTLDFTQPIALMVMGTIEHVMDTNEAYSAVSDESRDGAGILSLDPPIGY